MSKFTTYDGQTTTNAKWWRKLAWPLARWPKKSIQMLKQIGLYVDIIRTEYMPHVSLILLVPCLNIYLYPLYVLKINVTSRHPHPLCVLKINNLVSRQPHPLDVLTIDLTTRPKHHSLCRYYKLNHDTTAALCMCSSFKTRKLQQSCERSR